MICLFIHVNASCFFPWSFIFCTKYFVLTLIYVFNYFALGDLNLVSLFSSDQFL